MLETAATYTNVIKSTYYYTILPGNQTKGKIANMTAGSNMTGASMKSNMTSATKANSSK
ncbi:MAG TPA: hypothetical protein VE971_00160 [Candidatus Eisenbacteria bacterium]|nr:hypothetical protein [Candidatus Eisenbacteria bacterium]